MASTGAFPEGRTLHASQAAEMSELVDRKFSAKPFGTTIRRYLKVRGPDGPSTDAGRKARQSILLAPEEGAESPSLMCGWIDSSRRVAELRSFAMVSSAHVARFHQELDLSSGEYQRAIDALRQYLGSLGFDVRFGHGAVRRWSMRTDADSTTHTTSLWPWMVLAALAGFALCYALVLMGVLG